MMLLPPPKDACPVCATKHEPNAAHNAVSMYYLYRFYGIHGRWPTWADAVAHLPADSQQHWKQAVVNAGHKWTEPPEGTEPIAEPLEESFHRPIGDPQSPTLKDVLAP